jgi:hypothetical protein
MKSLHRHFNLKAAGTAVTAAVFVVVLVAVGALVVVLRNHATQNNNAIASATTTTSATQYSAANCQAATSAAEVYMRAHKLSYYEAQMNTPAGSPFTALHATVATSCAPASLDAFLQGPYGKWLNPTSATTTTVPQGGTTTTTIRGSKPGVGTTVPGGATTVIKPSTAGGNTVTTSDIPTIGNNTGDVNPLTPPTYPGK